MWPRSTERLVYQVAVLTITTYTYQECRVAEGRCKAFTTSSVVGCGGSELPTPAPAPPHLTLTV